MASKTGMLQWMKKHAEKGQYTALDWVKPDWKVNKQNATSIFSVVNFIFQQTSLEGITSGHLKKALKKNDKLVERALQRCANALGVAAANVLTTTGAEVLVLGGGVIEQLGDWLYPRILEAVKEHSFAGEQHCALVKLSKLGDDVVAVGAAMNALRLHATKK